MNQYAHNTLRKTIEIETPTVEAIQNIADERKWSFSYTAFVLLRSAIKERQRKSKKNHSESENSK